MGEKKWLNNVKLGNVHLIAVLFLKDLFILKNVYSKEMACWKNSLKQKWWLERSKLWRFIIENQDAGHAKMQTIWRYKSKHLQKDTTWEDSEAKNKTRSPFKIVEYQYKILNSPLTVLWLLGRNQAPSNAKLSGC